MPSVSSSGFRLPPGGTSGQVLFKKSDTNATVAFTASGTIVASPTLNLTNSGTLPIVWYKVA